MSYFVPQPHKCIKCSHEFQYSQSEGHPAPVLAKEKTTERGTYTHHMPVCPRCWANFLMQHVGLGYCTEVWTKDGSDYEQAVKEQQP